MAQRTHRRARFLGVFATTLAAATLLLPSIAEAAAGKISWTGSCLNERTGPGTGFAVKRCIPDGTWVTITCQTASQWVTGPGGATNKWDRLSTGGYVTDAFVDTGTNGWAAPPCQRDDYPYKADSTSGVDPWNFYKRQCTSFVAWRMTQYNVAFHNQMGGGRWGDAHNWDNNARALGYRVDRVATVGSIAQWNQHSGAPLGHVAYVSAISGSSVLIEEYNNGVNPYGYNAHWIPISSVHNFIHVAR